MNPLSKHRATTNTPRLEASSQQIDALNVAVVLGVGMAGIELAKTRRIVEEFRHELEDEKCDRESNTQMLAKWLVHLANDEETLRITREAFDFLRRVEITRIEVMT